MPDCAAQHFGPWMIEEEWFAQFLAAYRAGTLRPQEPSAEAVARERYVLDDSDVAHVQVSGMLTKGDSSFGGTSTLRLRRAVRSAAADEKVRAILLHVDSPGGTVAGTAELAADVRAADAAKPTYAHIEDMGASAAYWIASQARAVTATPTSLVGSIGTVLVLDDTSGKAAAEGVKVHVISTGPYKGTGADGAPVTEEQLAYLQERVDDLNSHFLAAIQSGRGRDAEWAAEVADGRVWIAAKAAERGLVDEVLGLDEVMGRIRTELLGRERPPQSRGAVEAARGRRLALAEAELDLHAPAADADRRTG